MTQAVEADIRAAVRIIRPEPLHAVGHRVTTVTGAEIGAGAVAVGVGLVGVRAVAVIRSGEHSAEDGAAEHGCTDARTPSSVAAPAHGLDSRRGRVLDRKSTRLN